MQAEGKPSVCMVWIIESSILRLQLEIQCLQNRLLRTLLSESRFDRHCGLDINKVWLRFSQALLYNGYCSILLMDRKVYSKHRWELIDSLKWNVTWVSVFQTNIRPYKIYMRIHSNCLHQFIKDGEYIHIHRYAAYICSRSDDSATIDSVMIIITSQLIVQRILWLGNLARAVKNSLDFINGDICDWSCKKTCFVAYHRNFTHFGHNYFVVTMSMIRRSLYLWRNADRICRVWLFCLHVVPSISCFPSNTRHTSVICLSP